MKRQPLKTIVDCKAEFERMLKNSQTKVIMPTLGLGILRQYLTTQQEVFTDTELRMAYESAVRSLKKHLGHDVHIGAKYEDAYGMRMSRYRLLKSVGHLRYELTPVFANHSTKLSAWLPDRIKQHIDARVGIIPQLAEAQTRLEIAGDAKAFIKLINQQIDRNPTTFEIVSFALIKVHLERFACKVYRDTRTSAHDRGVDLATNFWSCLSSQEASRPQQSRSRQIVCRTKVKFRRRTTAGRQCNTGNRRHCGRHQALFDKYESAIDQT